MYCGGSTDNKTVIGGQWGKNKNCCVNASDRLHLIFFAHNYNLTDVTYSSRWGQSLQDIFWSDLPAFYDTYRLWRRIDTSVKVNSRVDPLV